LDQFLTLVSPPVCLAFQVLDRFKVLSPNFCTLGIHASHDGVHSLAWIVLQPAPAHQGQAPIGLMSN
jgi:hypothetical protein